MTSRVEIQSLISVRKPPRNHDQAGKVTPTPAAIPSALRRTNKANSFMGAFLKHVCGLSSDGFHRMSESQGSWGCLVWSLAQAEPASSRLLRTLSTWALNISKEGDSTNSLENLCHRLVTLTAGQIFLMFRRNLSYFRLCPLPLACHWAAERRFWVCLCSIRYWSGPLSLLSSRLVSSSSLSLSRERCSSPFIIPVLWRLGLLQHYEGLKSHLKL